PASLRRASRQRAEVATGTDDERPAVRVLADGLTDDERVIWKAPALAVIEVLVRVWDEVPARVLADLLRRPERRRRGERRCRRRKQQCRHCETRKCPSHAHRVLHLRVARMAGVWLTPRSTRCHRRATTDRCGRARDGCLRPRG